MASTISVITITRNEEKHLDRALKSVKGLADEIVVVDSQSTDDTVEIAKRYTEKVFVNPWSGYGPQKNFAREKASSEWILQLDADEEVPAALAEEIKKALKKPQHNFYWLPIITIFLGKPLFHLWGVNLRLFRREMGTWDDKKIHEQVERTPKAKESPVFERRDKATIPATVSLGELDCGTLKNPLTHHSHYQTLTAYRERQERYSTADAYQMRKTGKDRMGKPVSVNRRNPFSVIRFLLERPLKQFIRKFVYKRGVLDGWRGWLWCSLSAEYEFKMCRKYLKLLRESNSS